MMKVVNFDYRSCKCGNAALMIKPPSECPMKDTREMQETGQKDNMYCLISAASLCPICIISPSVYSSFDVEIKITLSGCE